MSRRRLAALVVLLSLTVLLVAPSNLEVRVSALETQVADLQRRVAALEGGPPPHNYNGGADHYDSPHHNHHNARYVDYSHDVALYDDNRRRAHNYHCASYDHHNAS